MNPQPETTDRCRAVCERVARAAIEATAARMEEELRNLRGLSQYSRVSMTDLCTDLYIPIQRSTEDLVRKALEAMDLRQA